MAGSSDTRQHGVTETTVPKSNRTAVTTIEEEQNTEQPDEEDINLQFEAQVALEQ